MSELSVLWSFFAEKSVIFFKKVSLILCKNVENKRNHRKISIFVIENKKKLAHIYIYI